MDAFQLYRYYYDYDYWYHTWSDKFSSVSKEEKEGVKFVWSEKKLVSGPRKRERSQSSSRSYNNSSQSCHKHHIYCNFLSFHDSSLYQHLSIQNMHLKGIKNKLSLVIRATS